ncbi:MAG: VWA domain-containing protein [Clostridiaceae bacterium]|nr:VWA domain-containing protein [Clostridiaceae bacterium]
MTKKSTQIDASDFGKSTRRRLPICFCLDVSGSMAGNPIRQLNEGLQGFFSSIRENEETRAAADICIVTFGGTVDIFLPFGRLSKETSVPQIQATTSLTPIGEGILTALELLTARKEGYKELGIKYYQPWLVVITDGAPQGESAIENMEKAIATTNELESSGRLVVFNIGVGNGVDFTLLKRLSIKRPEPICIDSAQFSKLFEFLGSSSSSIVSSGMKDDALYSLDDPEKKKSVAMDEFFKYLEEE